MMKDRLVSRPMVGVVADDITGAGDIGVMFAKHGYAVWIFGAATDLRTLPKRLRGRRCDVAIIDTNSRLDEGPLAYWKVRRATAALMEAGCQLYWKKTCSVFRGNVGAEFDALLDELGEEFGTAVAAFPKNGRCTRGGLHYVHGRLLADSEFARDPVHPMTESDLVTLLGAQTRRAVGPIPLDVVQQGPDAVRRELEAVRAAGVAYALCDAERQEDLAAIAAAVAGERVLLGSSALAEELPRVWAPPEPFDPLAGVKAADGGGVLALAGSVMPQSQAQVAAMADAGARVLTLTSDEALKNPDAAVMAIVRQAAEALQRGIHTVIRSENHPDAVAAAHALGSEMGMEPAAVSRLISALLARAAQEVVAETGIRRLLILGGETSGAVCRALGISEMLVVDEIAPGLPVLLAPGDPPMLLVLKSGSFGGPRFALEAIEHLLRLGK